MLRGLCAQDWTGFAARLADLKNYQLSEPGFIGLSGITGFVFLID
jgi:hypothetical protein